MGDVLRINERAYSYGSIRVKAFNELFVGFTSISYADKLERTKGYGMARHHAPRIRSAGRYSIDPVKLSGPLSSTQEFRNGLARLAPDGKSYGRVVFGIFVDYVEEDETPFSVEIVRCAYAATSTSHDESADSLKEEIEIDAMYILRNGLSLFDSTEGMP